jgi:chromate reductase
MYKVAVVVGSLRRESHNLKLAKAWIKLSQPKLQAALVDISDLPIINEDLFHPQIPEPARRMKQAVEDADGVLLVSPEYNRSVTPAMKNVVDWCSRPWGDNSLKHRPVAIAGVSLGAIGTAVGAAALRTPLIVLDAILMGQPEIYLRYKEGMFTADHDVPDDGLRGLLQSHVDAFQAFIARVVPAS